MQGPLKTHGGKHYLPGRIVLMAAAHSLRRASHVAEFRQKSEATDEILAIPLHGALLSEFPCGVTDTW